VAQENRQQREESENGGLDGASERGGRSALLERAAKTAAVAALAGTTAVAASKALGSRGPSGEEDGGGNGGNGGSKRRRAASGVAARVPQQSRDQLRSAAGQTLGTVAEVLTPVAESVARSLGTWGATASPELLRETVFPTFVDAFVGARKRGGSAAKQPKAAAKPAKQEEPEDEREAGRREREARREERRQERTQ
jgi:hypothetical protein